MDSDAAKNKEEPSTLRKCFSGKLFSFRPTVELVCFLYGFAEIVQRIVVPNMYLDKVCQVNFNKSAEECSDRNHTLEDDSLLVDAVQSYVATLNIYGSLIKTIPSIFFVLFMGPWSDKHGRKPLMIVPLIGATLSTSIFTLIHYLGTNLTAEYLLLAETPISVLGGSSMLNLAFLSYMADITSEKTRTSRMSLLAGATIIAMPIGSLASKYILEYGGHLAVFCTTLATFTIAMLWVVFFVQDSRGKGSALEISKAADDNNNAENKKEDGSVLKNLWRSFTVTFKARDGYKRACLTVILCMRCISIFSDDPFGMNYLYSRKKFDWDAPDYALFRTALCSSLAFGSLVLMPLLSNYFKVSDIFLGISSLLGDITTCLLIIFSTSSLMFYFVALTGVIGMGIVTVMNAMPSKLVPNDELGNVYAVMACAESILPLIASPAINLIYANTVDFFPGCVYLFGLSLDIVLIILFVVVILLQRREALLEPSAEAPVKDSSRNA